MDAVVALPVAHVGEPHAATATHRGIVLVATHRRRGRCSRSDLFGRRGRSWRCWRIVAVHTELQSTLREPETPVTLPVPTTTLRVHGPTLPLPSTLAATEIVEAARADLLSPPIRVIKERRWREGPVRSAATVAAQPQIGGAPITLPMPAATRSVRGASMPLPTAITAVVVASYLLPNYRHGRLQRRGPYGRADTVIAENAATMAAKAQVIDVPINAIPRKDASCALPVSTSARDVGGLSKPPPPTLATVVVERRRLCRRRHIWRQLNQAVIVPFASKVGINAHGRATLGRVTGGSARRGGRCDTVADGTAKSARTRNSDKPTSTAIAAHDAERPAASGAARGRRQ